MMRVLVANAKTKLSFTFFNSFNLYTPHVSILVRPLIFHATHNLYTHVHYIYIHMYVINKYKYMLYSERYIIILKIINRVYTWPHTQIHNGIGGFWIFSCPFAAGGQTSEANQQIVKLNRAQLSTVTKQMLKIAHANRARSFRARPKWWEQPMFFTIPTSFGNGAACACIAVNRKIYIIGCVVNAPEMHASIIHQRSTCDRRKFLSLF